MNGIIIYSLISILIFLGYFIKNPDNSKKYFILIFVLIFIFTAFRSVDLGGTDSLNYQDYFQFDVPALNNLAGYSHKYEIFFAIFASVSKNIINSYEFFQILYTSFSLLLLFKIIKLIKINENERFFVLFSYFTYTFLWNNFVLLRQNIAILIIWYLLIKLNETKIIKKIILIIISILWHISSIFNLLLIPLLSVIKKFKVSRLYVLTLILSLTSFIVSTYFSDQVFFLISIISGDRFSGYEDASTINYINLAFKLCIFTIYFLLYNKIEFTHKKTLFAIASTALILSSYSLELSNRLVEYYTIGFFIILAIIPRGLEKKWKPLYLFSFLVVMVAILVRFIITFSDGQLLEFSFMF